MFLKSKRLQKVLAALAITGLLSFGATSVQADATFEETMDLSAVSGASVTGNIVQDDVVCVLFGGLGASQSVDLTNFSLTAYMDADAVNDVTVPTANVKSDADGNGSYCFSNTTGGNAEGFSPFLGYTKVVVAGSGALANINFTDAVDLSAIDGASLLSVDGGNAEMCLTYQGLGPSRLVKFKDLVLKGFDGQTEAVSVELSEISLTSNAEGTTSFCFSSAEGQNAADFNGFATYTSVSLAGAAILPVIPTVNAVYNYATPALGEGVNPVATGDANAEQVCVYFTGLPSRAELAITGVTLTVNKGLQSEAVVSLEDYSNFAAYENGGAGACWGSNGDENNPLFPLGDLSVYLSYEFDITVEVDEALTIGNVELNGTIDSSLFPELEIVEATPYVDPHFICFEFTGGPISQDLRLSNIELTLTTGDVSVNAGVSSTEMISTDDQGRFSYCLGSTVADPDSYGNLTTYDSIDFSAKLTVASEWSDVLSRYLATRGLTLKDKYFYYDSEANRTNVSVTVANEGETRLAYNVLGFQWEDQNLIGYEKFWLVPAGEERYFSLGYVTGDATEGDSSVDVWTLMTPATPSVFNTSRLKLPAGVVVSGDAFDLRYFPSDFAPYLKNKTQLVLVLENTTDEPITVKVPLTWKVGSSTVKTSGFGIATIEANSKISVQGNLGNELLQTGDLRQGASISVSGTVTKVAENVVDTSAFTLPDGYEVVRWDYNFVAADKRTEVYATIFNECAPEDLYTRDDLVATDVFVNNSTKANGLRPVATGWCYDSGSTRTVLVAYLSGDQRFGKSIKIATEWSSSVANEWPNDDAVVRTSYNGDVACYINGGGEWLFEANATGGKSIITVSCYNFGTSTAKIDLSGLTGSYLNEEEVPVVMAKLSGVNKIKLGVGQYKNFKVLSTPGEVRTGGFVSTFAGTIKISKY